MDRKSGGIVAEVEPGSVGFDAGRLERINRHFSAYVDDGRLAGWLAVLSRRGQVAWVGSSGNRDAEEQDPVTADTIWRLYSMTKPITTVAAMMLYEEGAFDLRDPVSKWIPSFESSRVYSGGPPAAMASRPSSEPVRVWHLMTHTAGLTYGFMGVHPVDAAYRAGGYEAAWPEGVDLAQAVDFWAAQPLLFEPGTEWSYSVATDVLGRLVEVISGQSLDRFFAERILGPLDMFDAGFQVEASKADRLAKLYAAHPRTGLAFPIDGSAALSPPSVHSGGGGLMGTARDYHRFTQMLLNRGQLDGVRLLSPRTVDYMTTNHLPGGVDLESFGRQLFSESQFNGVGFGLGFAVSLNPAASKVVASAGEYNWGGAASTAFWVDPAEQLTALFFTQLIPSSKHPIRDQLRQLTYSALTD